jgi:hypothetical protein
MFKFGYAQAYVIHCGKQVYIGHTHCPLLVRLVRHKSDAKLAGSNCKLHCALRFNDYRCTISHIQDIFYSVASQGRKIEDGWIDNYDSLNNGLNSIRSFVTAQERKERKKGYDEKSYVPIVCWNCDKIVVRGKIARHKRTIACSAIEMNSLKLIKMYL